MPGGRPTSAIVPRLPSMPSAWLKAFLDTAVTSTPSAPPHSFLTSATGSVASALIAASAPISRARASFSSEMSTAITLRPMAFAYCTATWPRPPIPEITTVSPGLVSVSFRPL